MELIGAFEVIMQSLFLLIGIIGLAIVIIAFFSILGLALCLIAIDIGRWLLVRIKVAWKRSAEEILANKLFIKVIDERKTINDRK